MRFVPDAQKLRAKWFAPPHRFYEKVFQFFSGLTPDIDMVVRSQKAGLEFAI